MKNRNKKIFSFYLMLITSICFFYMLYSQLGAIQKHTEIFNYFCLMKVSWPKTITTSTKGLSIYREYYNSNHFLEYGYFNLDSTTHYNIFKIENNRWYFKEGESWKLFYFDGITNKDTISFWTYTSLSGPYCSNSNIIWLDTIYKFSKEIRIFKVKTENYNYIFDKEKGIVGLFEYNPGFFEYLDTCWRDPF